jgi:hypothetical protein
MTHKYVPTQRSRQTGTLVSSRLAKLVRREAHARTRRRRHTLAPPGGEGARAAADDRALCARWWRFGGAARGAAAARARASGCGLEPPRPAGTQVSRRGVVHVPSAPSCREASVRHLDPWATTVMPTTIPLCGGSLARRFLPPLRRPTVSPDGQHQKVGEAVRSKGRTGREDNTTSSSDSAT